MDQTTSDRLEMYLKWGSFLDLDYDKSYGVDSPDGLVQISRDGLQEQIEKDISVFSANDLMKIKEMDLFILANIDNSSRWLSSRNKPKSYWWNYLDMIKSGEMEAPDIEKIFEDYNVQLN